MEILVYGLQAGVLLYWQIHKRPNAFLSVPPGVSLTVSLAGGRAVVGAEARLHLPASDLQLVRVGQVGAAHVAHPLLLARSALRDVDRHPRSPWGVPLHLRTGLQVTGFVFLNCGAI